MKEIIIKDLLKTNIYDTDETIIIIGSCLPYMQPIGYEKLKEISSNIYDLCLEQTHINMAITKIGGMLRTGKVKKLIFASVNKSPHCIQMHYIRDELNKMMNLEKTDIINYVIENDELIKIEPKTISLSKNLVELSKIKEDK